MNIVETLTDREVLDTAVDLLKGYSEQIISGEIDSEEIDPTAEDFNETISLTEVIHRMESIVEKMDQLSVENI